MIRSARVLFVDHWGVDGMIRAAKKPGDLIVYPDTGHIPEVEQVEAFNRDILSFLDGNGA